MAKERSSGVVRLEASPRGRNRSDLAETDLLRFLVVEPVLVDGVLVGDKISALCTLAIGQRQSRP